MRFFPKFTANATARRTRRARSPMVPEQLEGRQLLAGGVIGINPLNFITLPDQISAVENSAGQVTSYAIDGSHAVSMHDSSGFHNLGGYVTSIGSAIGSDGRPEVFGIGGNKSVYVDNGGGWKDLGGVVKQFSVSTNGIVYAIGTDNGVWERDATTWHNLGGYTLQVAAGNGQVWVIGRDYGVWEHDAFSANQDTGWHNYGGQVLQVSVTTNGYVDVIGMDNALYDLTYKYTGTNTQNYWRYDGGYVTGISANDSAVFGIGGDGYCYSFHFGQGWSGLGGPVTAVGATGGNAAQPGSTGLSVPIDQVFVLAADGVTPYVSTKSSRFKNL